MRTLVTSQIMAAGIGLITYLIFGSGYISGGCAMVLTITLMILLDVVHLPAVSTSLSFALRTGKISNLALFGLAVGITAALVLVERLALWVLSRYGDH